MSKKMTNCKACGAEIAKGATCPHCGAKNKKGCLPGVLAVFAVLVIVGMIGGGSESADNEVESTDVVQEEVQQTVEATEEETAGAETVDAATVMDLVRLSMVDAFDYYNIEGDETGFTIYVGFDGLATDTLMAKASGYDETYEPWAESRKAILSLHESTYE